MRKAIRVCTYVRTRIALFGRNSFLFLLKDGFRLTANGAYPCFGKFLEGDIAGIYVSANRTDVFALGLRFIGKVGRGVLRRFSLDDGMIIGVRHGRVGAQNVGTDHFAQKDGMRRRVHRIYDAAGDIGAGVAHDREGILYGIRYGIEFVEIPAGAETECADNGGIGVFRQYRNRKMTAVGNASIGVVVFIDADHYGCGRRGDLRGTIGGTAGRPTVIPSRNDVYAVRHGVECFRIHKKPSFAQNLSKEMRDFA